MGDIGIIVPIFNRFKKTLRFIRCLEEQTFKKFTLYLCDSGSTDGSSFLPTYCQIPITLIPCSPDDWWTGATNKGVKTALSDGCQYILTINDDSIVQSDYLELMHNLIVSRNLRVLGSRVDFSNKPGLIWCIGAYNHWRSRKLFQLKYHNIWFDEVPYKIRSSEILKVESLCGNGVLIESKVFEEIGFYNQEWCPHYHADSEFVMRVKKNGIDIYSTTQIVVYNDINNNSEVELDEPQKIENISKWSNFKSLFFQIKSDLYWKPIIFIIIKYSPRGDKIITLIFFYFHWLYVFYLEQYVASMSNSSLIPHFAKNILRLIFNITKKRWNSINRI